MRLTEAVATGEHARLRHARSSRRRLCGILLCMVSAVVIVTGLLPFRPWDLGDPDANGAAVYLSFFLLYVGWALFEGRKTPVIYLRRFGSTSANRVITDAIGARLGSAYRVVTLDDLEIQPTYPPRIHVLFSVLAPLVLAVCFVGISTYVYELRLRRQYSFGARLDQGLAPMIIELCFGACGIMASIHTWRVIRRSHLRVVDTQGVREVTKRVLKLSNWLRGPRLMDSLVTVVRVADSEWKSMVASLLEYTQNVIVDVSVPTTNVLWELEQLSLLRFRQCVIIANREQVLGWLDTTPPADEARDLYDRTRALLADREILLYDSENPAHARAWQENLHRALDNVTAPPRHAAGLREAYLMPRVTSVLTTALFYALVVAMWLMVFIYVHPLFEPIQLIAKSLAGTASER
ncbi:MAG TPA: hypothetical protein VFQ76_10585 [Longimicrobiaceae bacterium]|nr:hypothetical protein [Longimicrobiaceae bacterium]